MPSFDDLDQLVEKAKEESHQKAQEKKDKPQPCSLADRQCTACEG